jgi:hypothetical protein
MGHRWKGTEGRKDPPKWPQSSGPNIGDAACGVKKIVFSTSQIVHYQPLPQFVHFSVSTIHILTKLKTTKLFYHMLL